VRCLLLPAVLDLIGERTWKIPAWLDRVLPRMKIEGASIHAEPDAGEGEPAASDARGRERQRSGVL
jgi:RND superfamily putative drug exporter